MYAKCGEINDSKNVFLSIVYPDLVSWNSLISGCAQHGDGNEAIELFEKMMESTVEPDHTTYLAVISACSRAGHVERGLQFFHQIKGRGSQISAVTEHYASVVDLLGRAGHLDDAESFVKSMLVKPGVSVYRALLSACQVHGNVGMAKRAAKSLFELCPNDSGTHILLSNVFAADGSWQHAHLIRKEMMHKRVRKEPGWSWIDSPFA
ncbi:hypothetical protein HPP92_020758 [Vanilla planifolia]|uniref:Pentatricopeptide repeat-containing protein n=1 Tax=Vanilla planifolia TaxID=51239 RepID=A0A835Q6L6_VANPL|nr:hypothetical protein HPP92_020758 [Vanilla planifolia]